MNSINKKNFLLVSLFLLHGSIQAQSLDTETPATEIKEKKKDNTTETVTDKSLDTKSTAAMDLYRNPPVPPSPATTTNKGKGKQKNKTPK